MVGGGNNAFIGAVHRAAALMDNRIELVCGCFSSHPDISLASGREYFLPDNRIYGEKGGIEWRQEEPNTLLVKRTDRPTEIVRVGNGYMGAAAKANTRTPAGHPEGYIEAFANIYRNFARTVMAKRDGREPEASWLDFPGVDDGIRGMQFIETVVRSGYEQNVKWIKWIE